MSIVPHNGAMKLGAFVGWGIVIYAVMRLTWEGLVLYGFSPYFEYVVLVVVCIIAGRALRFSSWKDIVPYALSWAAIGALLDVIYVAPFLGRAMYTDWSVWLGYVLVVLLPLLAPHTRRLVHTEAPLIT